jgi:hypothetical protein
MAIHFDYPEVDQAQALARFNNDPVLPAQVAGVVKSYF